MLRVTDEIVLDPNELEWEFTRASGPGGQNVNKVSTAVRLRFDAARSPSLPEGVRRRLLRLAGKRATDDGVVMIRADRRRTQEGNRRDALARLLALVLKATEKPKPRRKTRPTRASKERRLTTKKQRSQTKQLRGQVARGDD